MRKALRAVTVLPAAFVALALLGGCSSTSTTQSATDSSAARPVPAMADKAAGGPQTANEARASQAPGANGAEPAQRAIAYTANLRIRVADAKKVEPAAAKAKEMVTAANGYVARENTYGDPPTTVLELQVPADRYTQILGSLTKDLGEKTSLEQSAEDVTEEVADVDSRVESAEAALKRLRTLLSRAQTVGEVLQVSEELDQRQSDLDALKARQKSLSKRVKEASISLTVSTKDDEPAEERSGFLGGLAAGWDDFTGFVSGVLTGAGWLLPFSPVLIALFFLLRHLRKRRVRRRQAA